MGLNEEKYEQAAEYFGFFLSYLLFSSALFIILNFTHKLPDKWGYFHILGISAAATVLGHIIGRWLR